MPKQIVRNGRGRVYDQEDVDRGLTELALCAGNSTQAARRLKEQGHEITRSSLERWRLYDKTDRYEEIRRQVVPRILDGIAAEAEDVIRTASSLELKLLTQLHDQADAGEIKDPSSALQKASVAKGINLTHLMPLRNKPSQIVEYRHAEDILREIEAIVPGSVRYDVDGEAEELPASSADRTS